MIQIRTAEETRCEGWGTVLWIAVGATLVLILVIVIVGVSSGGSKSKGEATNVANPTLKKFLHDANSALVLSFEKRDVKYFSKYCTDQYCEHLCEIFFFEDLPLFGSKTYRKVSWEHIGEDGAEVAVIQRFVRFNNIKLKGMVIPLGEDVKDHWYVRKIKRGFIVENIL
jgi:hypothetical protein